MITPPYEYDGRPAAFLEAVYAPVANSFERDLKLHAALHDEFDIDVAPHEIAYAAFFGTGPGDKYRELARLANGSKSKPNTAFHYALAAFWTLAVLTENGLTGTVGNA